MESILKNSLMRQSLDNVTVVMVAFSNFKRIVCDQNSSIMDKRDDSVDQRKRTQDSSDKEKK